MKKFFATLIMLYATAIDGDSIRYGTQEVRLGGIDAPEYHQYCFDNNNKKYQCGNKAFRYLQKLLKKPINCDIKTYDRYNRAVGVCDDLNKNMVAAGWAVSYYNEDYKLDESAAKKNKKGMWQGKFMRPEIYRAIKRKSK